VGIHIGKRIGEYHRGEAQGVGRKSMLPPDAVKGSFRVYPKFVEKNS
jgi:hypothetical protein